MSVRHRALENSHFWTTGWETRSQMELPKGVSLKLVGPIFGEVFHNS